MPVLQTALSLLPVQWWKSCSLFASCPLAGSSKSLQKHVSMSYNHVRSAVCSCWWKLIFERPFQNTLRNHPTTALPVLPVGMFTQTQLGFTTSQTSLSLVTWEKRCLAFQRPSMTSLAEIHWDLYCVPPSQCQMRQPTCSDSSRRKW